MARKQKEAAKAATKKPAKGLSPKKADASSEEDVSVMIVRKGKEHLGRWTKDEHDLFLKGLEEHGREWKRVASTVGTRTVMQVRTHAQKYFSLKNAGQEMSNFSVAAPLTREESDRKKILKEAAAGAAGDSDKTKSPKKKKATSTPGAVANGTVAPTMSPPVNMPMAGGINPMILAQQRLLGQQRLMAMQARPPVLSPGIMSPPPATIPTLKDSDIVILPEAPLVGPNVPFMDRPANQEFKDIILANVVLWHALPSTMQLAWVQRLFHFIKTVRGLNMVTMINGVAHEFHKGPFYISQQLHHDVTKAFVLETQGAAVTSGIKWEGTVIALVQGSWQVLDEAQLSGLCQQSGFQWIIRLPDGVTASPKYPDGAASPKKNKAKKKAATPKKKASPTKVKASAAKERKTPSKKKETPKKGVAKKAVTEKEPVKKAAAKKKEPLKKASPRTKKTVMKRTPARRNSTSSKQSVDTTSGTKSRRSKRQRL